CWLVFFFSSRRLHTMSKRDWSSDVCSSDLFGDDIQGFFPKSFDDFFGSGRSDIGQYPAGQITQEPGGILGQACLTGFCAELFTRSEERRVGQEDRYAWCEKQVKAG